MKNPLQPLSMVTLFLVPAASSLAQTAGPDVSVTQGEAAPAVAVPAGETKKPATQAPAPKGQVPGGKPAATPATGQNPKGRPGRGTPGGMPPGMVMPGMPKPQPPAWLQFKLNPKTKILLDFTESSPDMVISIFARTSGITILKDPSFKTMLTMTSATSVNLKDAFEIFNTVLNMNGYELQKRGNLMVVGRIQPPPPPPNNFVPPPQPVPVIKTYPLQHASASQVARVVTELFSAASPGGGGGGGGFPDGVRVFGGGPVSFGGQPNFGGGGGGGAPGKNIKVTSEDYSNSVIVSAMPNDHKDIEALIKDLDKVTSQPLESELFHLKYVPADQVLSAVQDILTSNTPTGRGAGRKDPNQNNFGFFSFSRFGGSSNQATAGGQSATAIKQTNSIIVNATKENLVLIHKLLDNLDKPAEFVGTTYVVPLRNAKATDVADLLNKVLTQKTNQNDNNGGFFFFDFDGQNQNNKKNNVTDYNEKGEIVNVRDVVGKVNIQADPNTNSLLIVTQPSNMKPIGEMIAQIDKVAEQVMIETIIVEANLDKTTKLGVEWSFLENKLFGTTATGAGKTDFGIQTATTTPQGLSYTISGSTYKAFVNAMQTDTKFKVLDTPRIFTSNNVKAEINVSQKLPYITSQQTGTTGGLISNYQFQDVGVVLTVTPRITSNGQVSMDVIQSADDLAGFTTFNAPIINHRQASTTVSVKDGETVILGGIIRNTLTQTDNKVPILGDIPLLGNLFRSHSKTAGQTELMVFLTPHIVHSNADAQRLREEQSKQLTPQSQESLKKLVPPPGGKG